MGCEVWVCTQKFGSHPVPSRKGTDVQDRAAVTLLHLLRQPRLQRVFKWAEYNYLIAIK